MEGSFPYHNQGIRADLENHPVLQESFSIKDQIRQIGKIERKVIR